MATKATKKKTKAETPQRTIAVITAQAAEVLANRDLNALLEKSHSHLQNAKTDIIKTYKIDRAVLEPTKTKDIIHTVEDKHAWAIFLDDTLITTRVITDEDGNETTENYLIGYQNGLTARKNETHFSQKETDPFSHRIIFQPSPQYVSYSFFYGFFYSTLRHICLQTIYGENYKKKKNLTAGNVSITKREQILKKFESKYTFDFAKNPELFDLMHEYAITLVENISEICEKLGAPLDSFENELAKNLKKQRGN